MDADTNQDSSTPNFLRTILPTPERYELGVCKKKNGERGANMIRIGRSNLRATWDGLLGGAAKANDVRKRVTELQNDEATTKRVLAQRSSLGFEKWIDAEQWLKESRGVGRRLVYTPEVLEPVTVASRGLTGRVELPKLSESYLVEAGNAARIRATQAGYRLADVLTNGLNQ
jgi:hypothetical protein